MSYTYSPTFQTSLMVCMAKDSDLWHTGSQNLTADDFGPNYLKFLFCLIDDHYRKYNSLPSRDVLLEKIGYEIRGETDIYGMFDIGFDGKHVAAWFDRYDEYTPCDADVKYYTGAIPDFIQATRMARIQSSNLDTDGRMQAFMRLGEEVEAAKAKKFTFIKALGPLAVRGKEESRRFGIGVDSIDCRINGGIMRQQGCLVVAPTGVGKTMSMLGAMANASRLKEASLFIALEMPDIDLMRRYLSLLGDIPAHIPKIEDTSKWPEAYRLRYERLQTHDLARYGTILNLSKETCTVAMVSKAIKEWKKATAEEGMDPDKVCTTVYIDWLGKMAATGLPGVPKNTDAYQLQVHVVHGLSRVWAEENVRMFISTQTRPEAKGKEVLTTMDVAGGKAACDPMDVVIGFAPVQEDILRQQGKVKTFKPTNSVGDIDEDLKLYIGDEVFQAAECSRRLNCTFMKSRDSMATDTWVSVYQGPTLRLWRSQAQAQARAAMVQANPYVGLE